MTIQTDTKKSSISDKDRAMIEKKVQKLDKFFRDDAAADVKFSELRGLRIVEITVHSAHIYFRAQGRANDFLSAADDAVDAISRQIRKYKTKLDKRLREDAFDGYAAPEAEQEEPAEGNLIRRKRFALKPMSEEEAALQMHLLSHHFYVFKNAEDGNRVCVVYAREDGGYGLIETE